MKIHRVKCSIDWENRFDNMQRHLGQHILSGCFLKLYNAQTIAYSLDKECATIDIDKLLDISQIEAAQEMANDIVINNINVATFYPNKSELKKLSIKKLPTKADEQFRVVSIEGIDTNLCLGLHPRSTLEVQLIKINKFEKYKTGTRIEFICGKTGV